MSVPTNEKANTSNPTLASRTLATRAQQNTEFSSKTLPAVTPGRPSPSPLFQSENESQPQFLSEASGGYSPAQEIERPRTQASREDSQMQLDQESSTNHSVVNEMDFDDLHAKFLSDIRDLEDLQNGNSKRLLNMEGLFATAYSESLHDQSKFLDLLDQLEKVSCMADGTIKRFQEF
jgi:hypothetical protein